MISSHKTEITYYSIKNFLSSLSYSLSLTHVECVYLAFKKVEGVPI